MLGLRPSGHSGVCSQSPRFYPPRCYQASLALGPRYYLRICHPLLPSRLGFAFAGLWFSTVFRALHPFHGRAGGLPGVRLTPSSYPVHLQCPLAVEIGYRGLPIHVCSPPSGHPYRWFAVRYVHEFCLMLPSDGPFLAPPLPCWRYFRPIAVFSFHFPFGV